MTTASTKKTAQVSKELKAELDKFDTKSAQIRYLNAQGMSRGDISRTLSKYYNKLVRYQHVRNVLIQSIKDTK